MTSYFCGGSAKLWKWDFIYSWNGCRHRWRDLDYSLFESVQRPTLDLKFCSVYRAVCVSVCVHACLVTQLCPTLLPHGQYSPLGSPVHGILQARTLKWIAIPISRRSSQPRDWTWVSCIAGGFFTIWATREALEHCIQQW